MIEYLILCTCHDSCIMKRSSGKLFLDLLISYTPSKQIEYNDKYTVNLSDFFMFILQFIKFKSLPNSKIRDTAFPILADRFSLRCM